MGLPCVSSAHKSHIEDTLKQALCQLHNTRPQRTESLDSLYQRIHSQDSTLSYMVELGETTNVNLSASGIAFHVDDVLDTEQTLLLRMTLKSSNTHLLVSGSIVSTLQEDKQQLIRLNFINLDSNNQDLLMRHLFQLQSQYIKQRRTYR